MNKDTWEVRVFYDGDCPLCMREIAMLQRKDKRGRIDFRDISAADFDPEATGKTFAVVKYGYMILLGGEDGFLCEPQPNCELPYFNDVWRSRDGASWELVTDSAGWSPRPGHQCAVVHDNIVCFGGFGLPENPMDVWVSPDGAVWEQVSDSPWNAVDPEEVKYDFEGFAVGDVIFTFGGDRETFDFGDPDNYLRVDNDVWRYALPTSQ